MRLTHIPPPSLEKNIKMKRQRHRLQQQNRKTLPLHSTKGIAQAPTRPPKVYTQDESFYFGCRQGVPTRYFYSLFNVSGALNPSIFFVW